MDSLQSRRTIAADRIRDVQSSRIASGTVEKSMNPSITFACFVTRTGS